MKIWGFTPYVDTQNWHVADLAGQDRPDCKESDARSLRGGGGELGNLKTLTYGFTKFTQR
jgi:hypothetical protein